MKRKIVHIDKEKCNGCGLCVSACHEGAIRMRDGKAELVSDIYCDGLGDCLGECPTGAITIEEREAPAFDPAAVAANRQQCQVSAPGSGCPGLRAFSCQTDEAEEEPPAAPRENTGVPARSRLRQWPVQMHLVPVQAPWWDGTELLLAADCVAVAHPAFHEDLLKGRNVIIACPKLDDTSPYVEKLAAILSGNDIPRLTVARMHVPCCGGIVRIAEAAVARSGKNVPLEILVFDHTGKRVQSAW